MLVLNWNYEKRCEWCSYNILTPTLQFCLKKVSGFDWNLKKTTNLLQPVVKTWSEESKQAPALVGKKWERDRRKDWTRGGTNSDLPLPLSNNTKAGREENNQSTLRNYWCINQMHPAVKGWPKCPENSPKARDKVQTQSLKVARKVLFYNANWNVKGWKIE